MSYFSTILTATKSRYQTLRGIDEQDGDSEDDSHISRVLRNYYQEQARPLPDWLGGGPPPPQNLRNNYGQQRPGMMGRGQHGGGPQNTNATLSDIWDKPPPQGNQRPAFGIRHQPVQQQGLFPGDDDRSPQGGGGGGNTGGAAGVAMTAQQRIKERLWGGRTASPPPNTSKPSPPPPSSVQMPLPPPMHQPRNNGGGYRPPQGPPPNQQHGGGGRSYGQSGMPWDDGYSGGGGGGGYSDGYDGSNFNPGFTPAGSPGSGSQGNSNNLRRGKLGMGMGLPTGPGMMRQQGGNRGGY